MADEDDELFISKVVQARLDHHGKNEAVTASISSGEANLDQDATGEATRGADTEDKPRNGGYNISNECVDKGAQGHSINSGVPGAFAEAPSGDISEDNRSSSDDDENGEEAGSSYEVPPTSGARLAVAIPVIQAVEDHANSNTLPIAQEEDAPASQPRNSQARRKTNDFLRYLIACLAVFFTCGIVLLIAFLSPKNKEELNDEIYDMEGNVSLASGDEILASPFSVFQDSLPESTRQAIQAGDSSPTGMAFTWLLEDPNLMNYTNPERILQRFVLATVFYATNGPSWLKNSLWLNYSHHECEWLTRSMFGNGEMLSKPPFAKYWVNNYPAEIYPCSNGTSGGLYQHLWLDQNNLKGSIPEELYLLTSLKSLSMGFNPDLSGAISTQISRLTHLEALGLLNSAHTGTIPNQVGFLTNLQALLLQSNQLTGSIPANLHLLTRLQYFVAGYNPKLTGSLATELGLLTNLIWLHVNEAALTGTMPTELGLLQNMTWLWTFNNTISGTVPSELGLLTQMTWLSSSHNPLTGTLPSELSRMTNLDILYIRGTHVSGPIPSEYGLMTSLEGGLYMESNSLTGSIPTEFGLLSNLITLVLYDNKLVGTVPSELGQLTSMEHFFVQRNSLSGSIPLELAELGSFGRLHNVLLTNNLLSGSLPEYICFVDQNCPAMTAFMQPPCMGLGFDCSESLCGCSCACDDNHTL